MLKFMATLSYGSDCVQPFECFSTLIDRHNGPASCFTDLEEYQAVWSLTKFTTAKPLDEDLWKKVRLTKSFLKAHVRAGVTPRVRRNYWLAILEVKDEDVVSYSHAIGQPEQSSRSPVVAPPQIPDGVPSFSQRPNFGSAYQRLMGYVMDCFSSVPNNSLLPVLVHVLLHLLEEWECYVVIKKITQCQGWLDRTVVEQTASVMTLKKLITSNLRNVNLSLLKPVGMSTDLFETEFLSLWYYWPFLNQPFWIVIRIIDLYLLEGPKVFYRLALAAVKMFYSSSLVETYRSCDLNINQILLHYLSTLTLEQRGQWLREALTIPHLSWKTIFKLWLQNCAIAQQNSTPLTTLAPTGTREGSNKKKDYLLDPVSEILSPTLSDILVNWLPEWSIGNHLECVFKASKHGYNLRTLYRKCEHEDAFILVIKSSESAIFGAFVVGNLIDRHNNTFFGSGETFLFTLKPHPSHYPWTAKSDLVLRANDEELIVGSGGGQFGLWIDGDLDRGSSASCTAYDNPPLTGTTAVDFKCSAIEVFKISWVQ